jgi:hypothetical protein
MLMKAEQNEINVQKHQFSRIFPSLGYSMTINLQHYRGKDHKYFERFVMSFDKLSNFQYV